MSFVPGVAMSNDQMSLPFSFSSSPSLIEPPGTFASAIFSASALETFACAWRLDEVLTQPASTHPATTEQIRLCRFMRCFLGLVVCRQRFDDQTTTRQATQASSEPALSS